ncbi:MAG: chemotaxis protein methyltransferase [bacterium]|nr:MAG: chemotaxis protein methyltransferase [bacterium]
MSNLKDLSGADFELLRGLIYKQSGISLNQTKKELLRTRLRSRLERQGFRSYRDYYNHVLHDESGQALVDLLDDISTNLTSFYREVSHFKFLESVLPDCIDKKRKANETEFRVWSAGCSSGEEPYTLAFTFMSRMEGSPRPLKIRILATDISTDVLFKASEGVYEQSRLEDVPKNVMKNYFVKENSDGKKKLVRVRQDIRDLITFRRFNLMSALYPFRHQFDFIFCRNVMIYFDKPTQEKLVGKYYRYLKPGGYLFIGHSESLTGLKHGFTYVQPTIYRR